MTDARTSHSGWGGLRARAKSAAGWVWYPTLLGIVLVLQPFAIYDMDIGSGPRVLVVALTAGLAATFIWTRLLGRDRGAAVAALTILGLVGATTIERLLVFLAAVGLIALEWAWVRRGTMRIRIPWAKVTDALSVVLSILVLLQVGQGMWVRVHSSDSPVPEAWTATPRTSNPDFFLILADGHGRRDVLARSYDYDMAEFASSLTRDGFDEAIASHANHALTKYSLPVLFNGRPLAELGQDMTQPARDGLPTGIRDSSAAYLLRSTGYEVTVIASGWEHLSMRGIDHHVDVGPRNDLERVFLAGTALGMVLDRVSSGQVPAMRARTMLEIDALRALAKRPSDRPQFVFVHLPAPHAPVVFNEDCSLRPEDRYTAGTSHSDNHAVDMLAVRLQADQTRCVDRLIGEAVHELVTNRPDAAVIVLSDHGPKERLDWTTPSEPGLGDRMANLFWARTPGRSDVFPEDTTLVNVLPILFNAYLGTDIPLHPNDLSFEPAPTHDRFVPYLPPNP